MINELKENQVFVFGSNLAGKHIGGGAKQALEKFGAIEGQSEGLQGQSYAFPTLTKEFQQRHHLDLKESIRKLFHVAVEHDDKEFLLTKVGCGIAGYSEAYMKGMFRDMPKNVTLPEDWK